MTVVMFSIYVHTGTEPAAVAVDSRLLQLQIQGSQGLMLYKQLLVQQMN